MNGIKVKARMRVEREVDLVLKNLLLKLFGQTHDEVLLTTDSRFKHYNSKDDRITVKDALPFRKYYGEVGTVKKYHFLIPQQLVIEVTQSCTENLKNTPQLPKKNCLQTGILSPKHGAADHIVGHVE